MERASELFEVGNLPFANNIYVNIKKAKSLQVLQNNSSFLVKFIKSFENIRGNN